MANSQVSFTPDQSRCLSIEYHEANGVIQRTQQVPQHVTALLSHLTSRPGVQSTLILSRKDGSIIQSTGELASQETAQSRPAQPAVQNPDSTSPIQSSDPTASDPTPSTYQPSQVEALAAHIFAFVSSASALGISLSNPVSEKQGQVSSGAALDGAYDYGNGTGTSTPKEEHDSQSYDREEDGEVKLLRMRTKKHEIVVVPDRKYLLCVVHGASAGPGANGARAR